MQAMGHAYREKLLPDRHALMFQMQSHATGDPEILTHVRAGFNELRRTVATLAGVPEEQTWNFFADGMLLNVVAMLELDWKPPERMIFRHRRAILVGSLVLVLVAAVFALPVFGELGNENDFDDPSAEAVRARNAIVDATGAFAAPQLVVLVRLGAECRLARGAGADPRGGRGAALPRRGRRGRLRAGRGRAARLARPALDLPARDLQASDPAGARPIIEQRLARYPWVTVGGGAVAAHAGGRSGLAGHRPRRADRVPDPVPAVAAGVPLGGLGAAAAGGGRGDDPAVASWRSGSSTPTSTRCRSTP